jgi:hypothetical protein
VLGGLMLAPHLTRDEESDVMEELVTTWGKAVHVWADPTTELPYGEPEIAWSITADGYVGDDLLLTRDLRDSVMTQRIARERQRAFGLPAPYVGLPSGPDAIGRQWTRSGPDSPEQRRGETSGR